MTHTYFILLALTLFGMVGAMFFAALVMWAVIHLQNRATTRQARLHRRLHQHF